MQQMDNGQTVSPMPQFLYGGTGATKCKSYIANFYIVKQVATTAFLPAAHHVPTTPPLKKQTQTFKVHTHNKQNAYEQPTASQPTHLTFSATAAHGWVSGECWVTCIVNNKGRSDPYKWRS